MIVYRLWIMNVGRTWRAKHVLDRPERARAITPFMAGDYDRNEAELLAVRHNAGVLAQMQAERRDSPARGVPLRWVVLVPVEISYSGDMLRGTEYRLGPLPTIGGEDAAVSHALSHISE